MNKGSPQTYPGPSKRGGLGRKTKKSSKKGSKGKAVVEDLNSTRSSSSKRPESVPHGADAPAERLDVANGGPSAWDATGGETNSEACGSKTEPRAANMPSTSQHDAEQEERLFPRYGSKMPVSPRRAKWMCAPAARRSKNDRQSSVSETVTADPSSVHTKVAKLNPHVASTVGAAAPKGEVWHEQAPRGPAGGSHPLMKAQPSKGQPPLAPRKWKVEQPPNVFKDMSSKPKAQGGDAAKPTQRPGKSGGSFSQKSKRSLAQTGKEEMSTAQTRSEGLATVEPVTQSSDGQGQHQGVKDSEPPQTTARVSPKSFPPRPFIIGEAHRSPGTYSSDSDDPDVNVPHSPKVVRAMIANSSSAHETPRSGRPWTAKTPRLTPRVASDWKLGAAPSDRSHHSYTRRGGERALTSIELEAKGAPQGRPLSPTVSDAFNTHFASREDKKWQIDENRAQLGFDSEIMNWDVPFSRPRRNSNPGSEISGVSDMSGYEYRQRDSDVRSRPGILGLGRFGGHVFQPMNNSSLNVGQSAPRDLTSKPEEGKNVDPIGHKRSQKTVKSSKNAGRGFSNVPEKGGKRGGVHQQDPAVLPYQQVQVKQDILQSPKGRSPESSSRYEDRRPSHVRPGSDRNASFGDDGSTNTYSSRSPPYNPTGCDGQRASRQSKRYMQGQHDGTRDDDVSNYGHPSSACGGRRRSFGGRILQLAVVAAAGVAAVVFGGELIKAVADEEEFDRDEER